MKNQEYIDLATKFLLKRNRIPEKVIIKGIQSKLTGDIDWKTSGFLAVSSIGPDSIVVAIGFYYDTHCHPDRDEKFVMEFGSAKTWLNSNVDPFIWETGKELCIPSGTWHRLESISRDEPYVLIGKLNSKKDVYMNYEHICKTIPINDISLEDIVLEGK